MYSVAYFVGVIHSCKCRYFMLKLSMAIHSSYKTLSIEYQCNYAVKNFSVHFSSYAGIFTVHNRQWPDCPLQRNAVVKRKARDVLAEEPIRRQTTAAGGQAVPFNLSEIISYILHVGRYMYVLLFLLIEHLWGFEHRCCQARERTL
jgi:hypothetical protein